MKEPKLINKIFWKIVTLQEHIKVYRLMKKWEIKTLRKKKMSSNRPKMIGKLFINFSIKKWRMIINLKQIPISILQLNSESVNYSLLIFK